MSVSIQGNEQKFSSLYQSIYQPTRFITFLSVHQFLLLQVVFAWSLVGQLLIRILNFAAQSHTDLRTASSPCGLHQDRVWVLDTLICGLSPQAALNSTSGSTRDTRVLALITSEAECVKSAVMISAAHGVLQLILCSSRRLQQDQLPMKHRSFRDLRLRQQNPLV